jgi:hypothetical protein
MAKSSTATPLRDIISNTRINVVYRDFEMNRKIQPKSGYFALAIFLMLPFCLLASEDKTSETQKNPIEKNDKVVMDKSAIRYDLTEGKTTKYKVTYCMNVWDDKQEKFIEDYSITGTLSLTMKGMDDKERYIISVESLIESALTKGKEISGEGYDKVNIEVVLKPSGGVTLDEDTDKILKASKYPETHARVVRALGVLYPPLPGTTQDFDDGKSKWKGCSVSTAKGTEIESINEWSFTYQGKKEKDMIIIEGNRQDNAMGMKTKVESQFKDGIITKGSMHYDRTIKDKIVLKCDMTAVLIEK